MEYYYKKGHSGNPGADFKRDLDEVGLSISHAEKEKDYERKLYGGEEWFFLREEGKIILIDQKEEIEEGIQKRLKKVNIKELEKVLDDCFLPSMLKIEDGILFDPYKSIKENALVMLGEIQGVLHESGIMIPKWRGPRPGSVELRRAWPFMYPLYHKPTQIMRCTRWSWSKATNIQEFQVDNRGDRKQGEKKSYLMMKLGTYRDGMGRKQVVWERAHRVVVWALQGGFEGVVMHTCEDERCVNPAHLLVGTQAQNTQKDYTESLTTRRKIVEDVNGGEWEWLDNFDWKVHKP